MVIPKEYLQRLTSCKEDVAHVLQEFLGDYGDLDYIHNLQYLCESAGFPDEDVEPEFNVQSAVREGDHIAIECEVFFDEKVHSGGCPDMPNRYPIHGIASYEIDLTTGTLKTVDPDC